MDPIALTIVWIVIVGIIVAVLAWFGPRPSQWRAHERAGDGKEPDDGDRSEKSGS